MFLVFNKQFQLIHRQTKFYGLTLLFQYLLGYVFLCVFASFFVRSIEKKKKKKSHNNVDS